MRRQYGLTNKWCPKILREKKYDPRFSLVKLSLCITAAERGSQVSKNFSQFNTRQTNKIIPWQPI